jgi:hypothetical protein
MALSEIAIPIAFAGGVDTKGDPKTIIPAKLLDLQNATFTRSGTLSKRTGYDALSRLVDGQDDPYVSPHSIAARGEELVLFADDHLLSYRESSDTWSKVGYAYPITDTERDIAATSSDQSLADLATLDGITVVAWEDSRGGVWYSIAESATGRLLRAPGQLDAAGERPRVVVCGDRLHVYYVVASASQIRVLVVNPSTYDANATTAILVDDINAAVPNYDAMTLPPLLGAGACIVWILATGGYRVGYVDPSGVIGGAGIGWPSAASWPTDAIDGPVSIAAGSQAGIDEPFLAVFWGDGFDLKYRFLQAASLYTSIANGTPLTRTSTYARIATATRINTAAAKFCVNVWAEEEATAGIANDPDNRVWFATVQIDGGDSVSSVPLRGHGLVSRGFTHNNRCYACVVHPVPFFPYVALVNNHIEDTGTPIYSAAGRFCVGTSDGLPTRRHLPSMSAIAGGFQFAALAREQVDANPSGQQFTETGIRQIRLMMDDPNALQSVTWATDLIIAGALPMRYDGDTIAEFSFLTAPDDIAPAVASTTGGDGLTLLGTYLYRCCYEEVDAQGLVHPGGMSIDLAVQLTGTENTVTIQIPTYRLTAKRESSVRIGVFRTEANDTAGDVPAFYRVTSLNPSSTTGPNRYVPNDTTVDTVEFVDLLPDLALLERERAYTNEGVLSNDPAPLGSVIVSGKDRIFWSDPTDPNLVRYSQTRRDGYGPESSFDLSLRIDQSGGDIGAMAILDDALFVFEERAVLFVLGPGPLANPDAAPQIGFSPPVELPTDAEGCTRPRSVAQTSSVILYQTPDGAIKQIDRSRQVSYIGAPVEAYNGQTVTSADEIPGKEQVIFLTSSGRTLLYDHFHGQWSTYTNHTGLDATVVGETYHYVRSNASDYRVFRADSALYLDAGVSYSMYIETAWIKFAQYLQGLQKVWYALILGTYISPHQLVVRIGINYENNWGQPYVIDVDADHAPTYYGEGGYGVGVYGGDPDTVYQQRIHVGAKCESIRFSFNDALSPAPQGASFELTELLLTGGIMRPSMVFGAGRTQ